MGGLELEALVESGSSSLRVPLSGFVDALVLVRDSISKKLNVERIHVIGLKQFLKYSGRTWSV